MKKLMHILFLSCLKATELIEKKMQFKLYFREKLQLNLHKSMCKACRSYEKQNYLIEMGIRKQDTIETGKLDIDLEQFKKTILKEIGKK